MSSYLLAIDGGGSKTHAVIADQEGNIVEESVVAEGSNPWKSGGFIRAAQAISNCLEKLTLLNQTTACMAGISGCHGDNKFVSSFQMHLASQLPQQCIIQVGGDLVTSFRASSPSPHGQLAIAGTGSAIAQFYADGTNYVFDGIGYGGRDLGAAIIASVQRGEQPHAVTEWLSELLGESPLVLDELGKLYHHKRIFKIAKHVAELPTESEVITALRPLILHCAWRWAYKLFATSQKYRTRSEIAADAPMVTVLSGGAWKLELFRTEVERLMQLSDKTNTIIFEPQKSSIHGAIVIARELALQ